MTSSSSKGNNPELWGKLLDELDEKMQFALLEKIRRAVAYHFEGDLLIIEAASPQDKDYFQKETVQLQLQLFAGKISGVNKVKIG